MALNKMYNKIKNEKDVFRVYPEQWYRFTLTYNDPPSGSRLVHCCVIVGANFVKRGL